jgi:hypothetical protein
VDIEWADVLRASLSFFLVVVGIGIAYVCFRLGGMLARMSTTVRQMTDEVVPILSRAQTTVDGINLELQRVDEIMVSAVNATKGAEKTVTSLSHAITKPVKKASGFSAAVKEAVATFRARRAAPPPEDEPPPPTSASTPQVPVAERAAQPTPQPPPRPAAPVEAAAPGPGAMVDANGGPVDEIPLEVLSRTRGPSISQISWALPKRRP